MKRQKIHLKAPDNWVNDPNGFIYYKGYYHVFYQYFPYGPRWGTMHWGHAVSKDLVNWEHKGIALFPTKKDDQNGCFSGSAVEKDGQMYIIYTGVRYEESNSEDIHVHPDIHFEATQMMITSPDGYTFDNWTDKKRIIPPITDPAIGHRMHTRDPKIWRGKDAWYMILGSTLDEKEGTALFYKSEDLLNWEYVNRACKPSLPGWMWECPDYFETEGGKVLLLSVIGILENGGRTEEHTICFEVGFREDTCEMTIPDAYQFLDYGLDLYAAQTTLDEAGRRVMIAWLRMPEKTDAGWIGMFSSPRVVTVRDGHICFQMHPNIRQAYDRRIADISDASPAGYMACFDLEDGEHVDIGGFRIYREDGRICTDRTSVSASVKRNISQTPTLQGTAHLEVLVDPHMIEVFINDGAYVITNAVYHLGPYMTSSVPKTIQLHTTTEDI